jgi:hypothetical protein
MKRRADGWLNATQASLRGFSPISRVSRAHYGPSFFQILKVAGFDKPQRTRVLEREVQKGTHEKVQGGYGKYQGKSPYRSHGATAESFHSFNLRALC